MKTITRSLLCALCAALLGTSCAPRAATVELFNGRDLTGWVSYLVDDSLDTTREFTVRDGVIHLSGKLGYIHTEQVYSDYRLEVEWRWPEVATNSGIFQRVQPEYQALPECYECQLKAGQAGDLIAMAGAATDRTAASGDIVMAKLAPSNEKPVGEWNHAEIECRGGDITVTINGMVQNRATGATLREGYIGLQSEGEAVEFRHVRLTPLTVAR
jgi:hypothetical protein